jgi:hypothetical protein
VISQATLVQSGPFLVQLRFGARTGGLLLGDASLALGQVGALLARLRLFARFGDHALTPALELALAPALGGASAHARHDERQQRDDHQRDDDDGDNDSGGHDLPLVWWSGWRSWAAGMATSSTPVRIDVFASG